MDQPVHFVMNQPYSNATSGAAPAHGDSLLLETGDYLLQEDGSSTLLLE